MCRSYIIFVSTTVSGIHIRALPLNFCNKKQEIEVGTWVAGIARFSFMAVKKNIVNYEYYKGQKNNNPDV